MKEICLIFFLMLLIIVAFFINFKDQTPYIDWSEVKNKILTNNNKTKQ